MTSNIERPRFSSTTIVGGLARSWFTNQVVQRRAAASSFAKEAEFEATLSNSKARWVSASLLWSCSNIKSAMLSGVPTHMYSTEFRGYGS